MLHKRRTSVFSRNLKFQCQNERDEEGATKESKPDKQRRRKFSMNTRKPPNQLMDEQAHPRRKMSMNVNWSKKFLEEIPESGQRSRACSLNVNKSSHKSPQQPLVQKNGRSLTISLPISHPWKE